VAVGTVKKSSPRLSLPVRDAVVAGTPCEARHVSGGREVDHGEVPVRAAVVLAAHRDDQVRAVR